MFVLLEHTSNAGTHWDLLVEVGGQVLLAGWRLSANPIHNKGAIVVERMPDHRRLYLDYEGEIGGGRGTVRRLDRGPSEWLERNGSQVRIGMQGTSLGGVVEITSDHSGCGTLRVVPLKS